MRNRKFILKYILIFLFLFFGNCQQPSEKQIESAESSYFSATSIIAEAVSYLDKKPITVTETVCERSAGTPHDFYSEGDYWWPNSEDPEGPYIRKDGQTNPENFIAHRLAMRDFSRWVASLTAAYKITKDKKYADKALEHLKAWFINANTKMNPNLLYGQAIKGRVTGRGIGIIDTIHLIEVAKSIQVLQQLGYLNRVDYIGLKNWFNEFLTWLTTHPYGLDEKDHGNNHSTWWAAQAAAFAELAERPEIMEDCRKQYKKLLAAQMDENGGFPDELERTKPFNYSLFNLEGYAVLAEIASTEKDNLWNYSTPNGTLKQAIDFMLPSIKDKSKWTYPKDVQHFDELPIQSASLLLASKAYQNADYLNTWKSLIHKRQSKEIDRTYPIRQLSLWGAD
ncbi:MAG: alginate lyase family protein [Bacteroidota bacterium]